MRQNKKQREKMLHSYTYFKTSWLFFILKKTTCKLHYHNLNQRHEIGNFVNKETKKQKQWFIYTLICLHMTAEILYNFINNFPDSPRDYETQQKKMLTWFSRLLFCTKLLNCILFWKYIPLSVKTKQWHCNVAYSNITIVISVTSFAIIFLLPLCFHRSPNLI